MEQERLQVQPLVATCLPKLLFRSVSRWFIYHYAFWSLSCLRLGLTPGYRFCGTGLRTAGVPGRNLSVFRNRRTASTLYPEVPGTIVPVQISGTNVCVNCWIRSRWSIGSIRMESGYKCRGIYLPVGGTWPSYVTLCIRSVLVLPTIRSFLLFCSKITGSPSTIVCLSVERYAHYRYRVQSFNTIVGTYWIPKIGNQTLLLGTWVHFLVYLGTWVIKNFFFFLPETGLS
jgi:hypothetical protein